MARADLARMALGSSFLVLAGACAVASTGSEPLDLAADGASSPVPASGAVDAGRSDAKPTGTTPPPAPPPDEPDASTDDAGDEGGADGGTTGGGPGPDPVSCDAPNACPATVTALGTVSGDTAKDVVARTGHTSEWLRVTVTEDDNGWFIGRRLAARLTLTAPAGVSYGLVVYKGSLSATECTKIADEDLTLAASKTLPLSWNDNLGSEDGKALVVEVRHLSGDCGAGDWSLQIEGNVP